jgi:hypothetical protein
MSGQGSRATAPLLSHRAVELLAGQTSLEATSASTATIADRNLAATSPSNEPAVVVPYVSHGIGVDESQFSGSGTVTGTEIVVPYLSHGIGVDESLFAGTPDATPVVDASGPAPTDAWYEGVAGIAGGAALAALLLAALSTLALRSRHGRAAMS